MHCDSPRRSCKCPDTSVRDEKVDRLRREIGFLCVVCARDQLRNARRGVGLHAWQNVGVLVHRELRGVVPEPF